MYACEYQQKRKFCTFQNVLATSAWLAIGANAALANELTVTIEGGEASIGQMLVSIFKEGSNFLKDPTTSALAIVDPTGGTTTIFDLALGTYAVAVIYDMNGNGQMDRTLFGLPAEPFGFSNNARVLFGPPAFHQAAFALPANGKTISILLDKVK